MLMTVPAAATGAQSGRAALPRVRQGRAGGQNGAERQSRHMDTNWATEWNTSHPCSDPGCEPPAETHRALTTLSLKCGEND